MRTGKGDWEREGATLVEEREVKYMYNARKERVCTVQLERTNLPVQMFLGAKKNFSFGLSSTFFVVPASLFFVHTKIR